ncbi:hypothetical protein LTR95_006078 [Oleoguttula sp. CCFEE 5521]
MRSSRAFVDSEAEILHSSSSYVRPRASDKSLLQLLDAERWAHHRTLEAWRAEHERLGYIEQQYQQQCGATAILAAEFGKTSEALAAAEAERLGLLQQVLAVGDRLLNCEAKLAACEKERLNLIDQVSDPERVFAYGEPRLKPIIESTYASPTPQSPVAPSSSAASPMAPGQAPYSPIHRSPTPLRLDMKTARRRKQKIQHRKRSVLSPVEPRVPQTATSGRSSSIYNDDATVAPLFSDRYGVRSAGI